MASTLPPSATIGFLHIFAMFDIFCSGLLMSTFHWFTSSGPLYSKTYSLHKPKRVIPSTCTRQEYSKPFTPKPFCNGHYIPYITCFFPQPEKPKSRAPSFLEKLATLLFTGLLLLDPSTAKLTRFINQNTSSQALAPDKNIPAAFYTKAFLQRPLHPIHNLLLPTARKAQK